MAIKPVGGEITSQIINDNLSYLESEKMGKGDFPFILAKDYMPIGNGVANDYVVLQKMFDDAVGKILILEKGKTYGIPNESTLTIPSNTTIISNGAKFKKITPGLNFVIQIGSNVYIDYLEYIPYFSESESGVKITGSFVTIDYFQSISSTAGMGSDSTSRNALFVDGTNGLCEYIKIGSIRTTNWDRPIQIRLASKVEIGRINCEHVRLAMYLRDVTHFNLKGGFVSGTSPNAIGNPGENGVLIESVDSDYGSQYIEIENVVATDTGEHGFRIGGQRIATDISFNKCTSVRPGRGRTGNGSSEAGVGHGGCGFKVLGPTSNSSRHRNISFINCIAENGRDDVPSNKVNFAGFQIGKSVNVVIDNPIVRNAANQSRAFVNGIEVIGCEEVVIDNPNIGYTTNNGIHFYDADPTIAGGDFGSTMSRVNVNGGVIVNPVNAGVYFSARNIIFRRLRIGGIVIESGSALYGMKAEKTNGSFASCRAQCSLEPTQSATSMDGMDDWLVDVMGVFTSTPNSAANGSTFRDAINGQFKVRKNNAWVAV